MRAGNAEALEDLISRRQPKAARALADECAPRRATGARADAGASHVRHPAFSTCRRCAAPPARCGCPARKSISNRVLLLAGLAEGTTAVHDLLDSDDTRVMLDALARAGLRAASATARVLHVTGLGGRLAVHEAELFLGNAGTAMRPLTAALAVLAATQGGRFELSGVPRMHERPIGDLVDALRPLGCDDRRPGRSPATRRCACSGQAGGRLATDAPIRVRGDVSSQFLTALLLALPLVSAAQRRRHRGRRRADLQALRRDHAEAAGALRHRGGARRLAALHDRRAAAATARRARSTSKAMRRRPRTSSRWAPSPRTAARRCASKAWAAIRSRATSASSTRRRPWAPRSQRARLAAGVARRLAAARASRWTATTSPTPR